MRGLIAALCAWVALVGGASAQNWTPAQIKQIEGIAQDIAKKSNENKNAVLDDMTVSFNATANGRNVRFENVIRVKKGLSASELKPWHTQTRSALLSESCKINASNPAFDRGLSYTYSYSNTYGEKLGEIFVDKSVCKNVGLM